MVSKKALNTLLVSAVALTVAGGAAVAKAQDAEKEKCYGVVKAGSNDCAASNGAHSCAGHSTADKGAGEWIALPVGICEKLSGGSLTPAAADGAAPAAAPAEAPKH